MMFLRYMSIIIILIGLYGIVNLFTGKRRPIHVKKDVKINNKYYRYYKYYYLLTYIAFIILGISNWIYGPDKYSILNPIYFYSYLTFNIMQLIGVLFIDSGYISK